MAEAAAAARLLHFAYCYSSGSLFLDVSGERGSCIRTTICSRYATRFPLFNGIFVVIVVVVVVIAVSLSANSKNSSRFVRHDTCKILLFLQFFFRFAIATANAAAAVGAGAASHLFFFFLHFVFYYYYMFVVIILFFVFVPTIFPGAYSKRKCSRARNHANRKVEERDTHTHTHQMSVMFLYLCGHCMRTPCYRVSRSRRYAIQEHFRRRCTMHTTMKPTPRANIYF